MKNCYFYSVLIVMIYLLFNGSAFAKPLATLANKTWFSGSNNCKADTNPAIEVFQFNPSTFILRQNKCLHYEAPFIYLLLGHEKSLLLDTGATQDAQKFPLAKVVQQIVQDYLAVQKISPQDHSLLVIHSHSHSDHIAADQQFKALERTVVIPPNNLKILQSSLELNNWPQKIATLDLGNRVVKVIPTPGHQREAISLYDKQTQWLLTGDTFYPGRLYIRDWTVFKNSIAKLTEFSKQHVISAILGAHIEMSETAKIDFPIGGDFHPNEAGLALSVNDLKLLNYQLFLMGDTPAKVILDKMIIFPVD